MDDVGMAAEDARLGDARREERGESAWVQAHRALSRLARQRAQSDAEEGRWLLRARRSRAHAHMGFGSFVEYVERLFGYKGRSTHEKLRVAEALEHLPRLAAALESGAACWSALRELTRVATSETEGAWLEAAHGKLVRELEPLVAGARPGDLPGAARRQEARRHVLRFEVSAETYATYREAVMQLRRSCDAGIDDDTALLAMARAVLGGPRDEGRASYQVSLHVCSVCGQGTQAAGGAVVPVGPAIVAMAMCDAQQLGHVAAETPDVPSAAPEPRPSSSDPPRSSALASVDSVDSVDLPHAEASAAPSSPQARVGERPHTEASAAPSSPQARVGERPHTEASAAGARPHVEASVAPASPQARPHVEAPVAATSQQTRVGARPHTETSAVSASSPARVGARLRVGPRTQQTIPPALRRLVLHRDHHRCRVPGCQNAAHLDLHHLQPRAEGGPNTLENLIGLCSAHHRAVHVGELVIEGCSSDSVRFFHADGTAYGQPADAGALEVQAEVFSALCQLGFRETQARGVLDELRREPSPEPVTKGGLLRAALERIGLPRRGP